MEQSCEKNEDGMQPIVMINEIRHKKLRLAQLVEIEEWMLENVYRIEIQKQAFKKLVLINLLAVNESNRS